MVLFPSPFYFVFDIPNLLSSYKIISSYELARPVMGTIFLVNIYIQVKKKVFKINAKIEDVGLNED